MLTEQQYELAAKFAESERRDSLRRVRKQMAEDAPGSLDGVCCDCGEHIGQERLGAIPGAARCIDCQTVREKQRERW